MSISIDANAKIWRCGLRALFIAIKVAYLPVHSKHQVRTASREIKNSHEQKIVESTIASLAADKWDVEQALLKITK